MAVTVVLVSAVASSLRGSPLWPDGESLENGIQLP